MTDNVKEYPGKKITRIISDLYEVQANLAWFGINGKGDKAIIIASTRGEAHTKFVNKFGHRSNDPDDVAWVPSILSLADEVVTGERLGITKIQ